MSDKMREALERLRDYCKRADLFADAVRLADEAIAQAEQRGDVVMETCGDCDPCIGGRPDQCAVGGYPVLSERPAPVVPRPIQRWPFVESPGEFATRLSALIGPRVPEWAVLASVRNVLIESPPTLSRDYLWQLTCAAPEQAEQRGEVVADTGNAEADRIINRLMSADPDFDDCEDAAKLIRRLAATPAPVVPDDVAKDAARYRWLRDEARHQWYGNELIDAMDDLTRAVDRAMLAAARQVKP